MSSRGVLGRLRLFAVARLLLVLLVITGCDAGPAVRWISLPAPETTAEAELTAPDILVVMVDTLRPDHLGIYGYPKPTSPFLDQWASGARTFFAAYSNATHTRMAVASLFTGARPTVHRVRRVDRLDDDESNSNEPLITDGVHERFTTVAEALQSVGYRTWGFSSNPHVSHLLGFHQGFDRWHETSSRNGKDLLEKFESELDRESVLNSDRPLFAYLHFMDVHNPYAPPPPWDKEFAPATPGKVVFTNGPAQVTPEDLAWSIGQYDGDIRYFDALFERLMQRWDQRGKRLRISIVMSDHGEEFLEHGGLGHGTTVYREQARIALLMKGPGIPPGVNQLPVQTIDVSHAILEAAQAAVPDTFQGRPVRAWHAAPPIYTEARTGMWSIRCGQTMAVRHYQKPDFSEIYYLAKDPEERDPGTVFGVVGERELPILRYCFEEFGRGDEPLADRLGTPLVVTMDQAQREQLEGLGYLGK